jgi:hypothetical protein
MTIRQEIQENLRVRFPDAKVSVKKATERAGSGVAYIAVIKVEQTSVREPSKITVMSFDESGKEIQNP